MGVRESEVGADIDAEYLRGAGGLPLALVGIAPRSHLASREVDDPHPVSLVFELEYRPAGDDVGVVPVRHHAEYVKVHLKAPLHFRSKCPVYH